jgi:hypothetical protein
MKELINYANISKSASAAQKSFLKPLASVYKGVSESR